MLVISWIIKPPTGEGVNVIVVVKIMVGVDVSVNVAIEDGVRDSARKIVFVGGRVVGGITVLFRETEDDGVTAMKGV